VVAVMMMKLASERRFDFGHVDDRHEPTEQQKQRKEQSE
jgi:hypothetical protein